tara:strand:- start:135 stop:770 length:636 start_codon:yes stop_codon:yes gene_type:complete
MTNKQEPIAISIIGFDDYLISSDGKVFSTRRKKIRELKPQRASQSKKKYLQVRLFNEDTYSKTKVDKKGNPLQVGKLLYVHRLVYENFVGEIAEGLTIDHIDEDTNNNSVNNLQVITQRQNVLKYHLKDGRKYLRKHRDAMIELYKECKNYKEVAKAFDCSITSVYRVVKNIKFPSGKGYDKFVTPFDDVITDEFATSNLCTLKAKWKKEL